MFDGASRALDVKTLPPPPSFRSMLTTYLGILSYINNNIKYSIVFVFIILLYYCGLGVKCANKMVK